MNKKPGNILLIILAVLLLVAISVAGYFFWQNKQIQPNSIIKALTQTDNTRSWKNYVNNQYHYSLSYPDNLILDERATGGVLFKKSPDANIPVFLRIDLMQNVNPKQEVVNRAWLDKFYRTVFGNSSQSLPGEKTEELMIDGKQAVKVTQPFSILKRIDVAVFVPLKFDILGLSFIVSDDSIGEMKSVDQILSTFKFTN